MIPDSLPFLRLVEQLSSRGLRFVLIGVAGADYWARSGGTVFATQDRDLLLPLDPENLLGVWTACRYTGYELWSGNEPLGEPLDLWLAERVVERRAGVKAVHRDEGGSEVDLTLVMAGFDFDAVWSARRVFKAHGVEVPVARLTHIVRSKTLCNRPKDRLFLATYEEALRSLLPDDPD